jgi:hypothetical protein
LIIDVFGVYVEGYVEDPKGQVKKTITLHALQSCRIEPHEFCWRLVECEEFGFAIFGEIPYNYICDISKRKGDLLYQ